MKRGDAVSEGLFAPQNRKWWTLGAVAFGLFMIMLDNTVVNVALPSIQRDLRHRSARARMGRQRATRSTSPSLLLTGGKLADLLRPPADLHHRPRRLLRPRRSPAAWRRASATLIAARAVQGVGAALMNPATLSIITATFPPRQRGTAIGIWAGVSAMALAIGPLVGGLLTEHVELELDLLHQRPDRRSSASSPRSSSSTSRGTPRSEQRLDLPGLSPRRSASSR